MAVNHFSGTANDFLKRNAFPDDLRGTTDQKSMRTARVDLAGAKSPTVTIAIPGKVPAEIVAPPNGATSKTTSWSSVITYLTKSFAFFGAAKYPAAVFAVEPARDEGQIPQLPPAATQHTASPEADRRGNHVTSAGYVIDFPDDSSRERERKIKTTVAALAELDDKTLLGMGIPQRSQIEEVVRHCYDC